MTKKSIYILDDPETGFPRWVGASSDPRQRFREHISKKSTRDKDAWIGNLKSKGLLPVLDVLSTAPTADWEEEEKFLISYLRFMGADLLNREKGGASGAVSTLNNGKMRSFETLEKQRKGQLGRKHSPESCANRSKALKGGVRSLEVRENMRRAQLGKRLGIKLSPESIAKRSETVRLKTLARKALLTTS